MFFRLVSPHPAFASHCPCLCLSVCRSLSAHLSHGCPRFSALTPIGLTVSTSVGLSVSPPPCLSQRKAYRSDGWCTRKRLTGVHLTGETAVARESGSERVTFPGAAALPSIAGRARVQRVGLGAGRCAIMGCQRPHFSSPACRVSFGLRGNWWLQAASGPRLSPDAGPSPPHRGAPSRGPSPLSGPFCESDVITAGAGLSPFIWAGAELAALFYFPGTRQEADGWFFFFTFSF